MNYKDAFYFVGQCLSLNKDNSIDVKTKIDSGHVDWSKVVWVATNHMVFATLYVRFKLSGLLPLIPTDLLDYLTDIYRINTERNRKILQQVQEINQKLQSGGISPIFMKGTACLTDGLYTHIGERMIGDIDLLVHEDALQEAVSLLNELGYSSKQSFRNEDVSLIKHYPRLIKNKRVAAVEVHRQPIDLKYIKYFNSDTMFSQKKEASDFPIIYVPSDSHKIVQNFIHGQLNDSAHLYGTVSLRNCYDLHLLEKRTDIIDVEIPQKLNRKFEAYRYVKWNIFGEKHQGFRRNSIYYQLRINANLKYLYWAKLNLAVLYLLSRWVNYIRQLGKAIYSSALRKSLVCRLSNPGWYYVHFLSYKKGLKQIL